MAGIKRANTSGITKTGTAVADVPDVPTIGTAIDGGDGSSASVTFTAAVTGGTPTSYTVTSTPGSFTGTGATSPVTVTGLSVGTAYTFKAKATNAAGTGPESSASNSVTPATPIPGAYDSLATVTVGTAVSSITFAGIPTGYKHLQIRWIARSTAAASTDYIYPIRFNGDTAANYSSHYINANGSTVAASGNANQSGFNFYGDWPAASATSGLFGIAIMDILDYGNTSKYKTVRTLAGFDANGSGQVFVNSASWRSTSAVVSFSLVFNGGNFAQNSSFALYGVK